MKVGSRLAIYKLKEINVNNAVCYEATVVEHLMNKRCPFTNKWEAHFYKVILCKDLPYEIASFDIDISPQEREKLDGTLYEIRVNPLSFERISNPKQSIIRVLDFEYKKRNLYKGKKRLKGTNGKPLINEYVTIYDCEFDIPSWQSPTRKETLEIKRLERLNKTLQKRVERLNAKLEERKGRRSKAKKGQ